MWAKQRAGPAVFPVLTALPGYSAIMTKVIEFADWSESPDQWLGEIECGPHGANLCLIFNRIEQPGGGPRLHSHPYAETFIIREGRGLFTIGDQEIEAVAGQILVVPAGVPHKFTNLGPGALESIDIHERGTFETKWLE